MAISTPSDSGADRVLAAVEGGGSKFICAVGHADGAIIARQRIETRSPEATVAACCQWFRQQFEAGVAAPGALGLACFGPLRLDRAAADYGVMLNTPKPGWRGFPLLQAFRENFPGDGSPPLALDTDVNAAALAEWRWGAARGCGVVCYITVGTGIGCGVLINGETLRGALHPELGHIRLPRRPDDAFAGHCAVHGDCLEGLAAGPALAARWGRPGAELPAQHQAWSLQAVYLAQLCELLSLAYAPHRIILGGGVMMGAPWLPAMIRRELQRVRAAYPDGALPSGYLSLPALGHEAGVMGALALAAEAVAARVS